MPPVLWMKDLPIYLNDHLAGSIAAIEMVEDLIKTHRCSQLVDFLQQLRGDIEADQKQLERLMKGLRIDQSKVRKAGAWLAEKASRLKLRVADVGEPNLALLQSLETLLIGIAGKRSLWRTLNVAIASTAERIGLDLDRLERRAAEQFERVEAEASNIAREVFGRETNGST